ncbi:putative expansin-A17 [Euphorbia lathyris]|uniref:putative expansin-A17 n=1 Tax=Euphorbia lathyris TaxID=212925 RepID=UPI0033137B38
MAKPNFITFVALFSTITYISSAVWLEGTATFYGGESGGACGFGDEYGIQTTAVSAALFNNGASCGTCYQIVCNANQAPQWCIKKTHVIVTVTDFYPPNSDIPGDGWCSPTHHHFDMSQSAFQTIADFNVGVVSVVPIYYRKVHFLHEGCAGLTLMNQAEGRAGLTLSFMKLREQSSSPFPPPLYDNPSPKLNGDQRKDPTISP